MNYQIIGDGNTLEHVSNLAIVKARDGSDGVKGQVIGFLLLSLLQGD